MIIHDEPLLSSYRTPGRCELCDAPCRVREPHHLWAKGMAGGGQLDIRINLIALGSRFGCPCHAEIHAGNVPDLAPLAVVADREGVTVREIADAVAEFRRLPKDAPVPPHLARFVGPTAEINPPRKRKPRPARCVCGRGLRMRGRGQCRKCVRERRAG